MAWACWQGVDACGDERKRRGGVGAVKRRDVESLMVGVLAAAGWWGVLRLSDLVGSCTSCEKYHLVKCLFFLLCLML